MITSNNIPLWQNEKISKNKLKKKKSDENSDLKKFWETTNRVVLPEGNILHQYICLSYPYEDELCLKDAWDEYTDDHAGVHDENLRLLVTGHEKNNGIWSHEGNYEENTAK